jgi:hypothetical protein
MAREGEELGGQVHSDAEARGGEREDEREIAAAQAQQRFQRFQEDAECVERAERRVQDGGGGDGAPRAGSSVAVTHDRGSIARKGSGP